MAFGLGKVYASAWGACFVAAAAACVTVPANSTQPREDVLVGYELTLSDGPSALVVPIRFHDQSYPFVVDTGSSITLFDSTLRSFLGQPVETLSARTGAGESKLDKYPAPDAYLGQLNLRTVGLVGCMDLSAVRETVRAASGQEICGLIGMDFLKRYILQIDRENRTVTLLDSGAPHRPEWGNAFALEYQGRGVPTVAATLSDGVTAQFVIDTGDAGVGDLQSDLFEGLRRNGSIVVKGDMRCATGSGYRETQEGRVDCLTLGPYRHEGLSMYKSTWNGLGLSYLARYVVTFDFPDGVMYLRPNARWTAG